MLGMGSAEVDRRRDVVEAGLQWAWSAEHQVRRLRGHEEAMDALLGDDGPVPAAGWQARFFLMRSDAEFCRVAASNLLRVIDELAPGGASWPIGVSSDELVEAIVTLRQAFGPQRASRRRALALRSKDAGVIDLRDDPARCTFEPGGTRICGLGLDELDAALEPVATCFATLERSAFAWEGWRALHA